MSPAPTCPPRGVYVPAAAFFNEDESLNLEAIEQHLTRLAQAGVTGLVIQGSNGEAVHLSHPERKEVLGVATRVLKEHGRPESVVVAGCGAPSTRETIQLCHQAHESGAHYALVLMPSYWVGAMKKSVIFNFFNDVASASPIPIILYNFPGVTSGLDLDSDMIIKLAIANPNIVGVKLTCGNMGKLQRVAHEPRIARPFAAFMGKSDFMLHGLIGDSHGVIAATANLLPRAHVEMIRLWDAGKLAEAQALQTRFSRADWALVQMGISGIKAALDKYYGYGGGRSRRPLELVDVALLDGDADIILKDLVDFENSLP